MSKVDITSNNASHLPCLCYVSCSFDTSFLDAFHVWPAEGGDVDAQWFFGAGDNVIQPPDFGGDIAARVPMVFTFDSSHQMGFHYLADCSFTAPG
jgi:hypothetical protein